MTTQAQSNAVHLAALMLCGRLYYRGDAPLGIAGDFNLGALHVEAKDPDVAALLRGRRGAGDLDPAQTWPTVAEIRDRWNIDASTKDDRIQEVLDAVVDYLTTTIEGGFGIG